MKESHSEIGKDSNVTKSN